MAYWDTYDEWLDKLDSIAAYEKSWYDDCYDILSSAYEAYWDTDYNLALIYTINCIYGMIQCWEYTLFGSQVSHDHYHLPTYFHNFAPAELTYKTICEAWGKDDFEGRAVTIAFIDRMRQMLWDEPYSATWAAKPEGYEE